MIGPREPWHDIHSKVEGSIAYDVFENFAERWEQQGTKEGPLTHIKDIYSIEKLHDHHPLHMDPQRLGGTIKEATLFVDIRYHLRIFQQLPHQMVA